MLIIDESTFRSQVQLALTPLRGKVRSVTGPGRSGAIASVYASHFLGVPWLPATEKIPDKLQPVLVVDTAVNSGATLRKLAKKRGADLAIAFFSEPPRVKFWYELEEKP